MNNATVASKVVVGTLSVVLGLAFMKAGVKVVLEGTEGFAANISEKIKG